jgi:hypothetical protein
MHINSIDTIPEILITQPQAASLHVTSTSGHCDQKIRSYKITVLEHLIKISKIVLVDLL